MKKLLIVGTNTIHTYNYIALIRDYFDDVLLITNQKREGFEVEAVEMDFSLSLLNVKPAIRQIRQIIYEYQPTIIHVHQANSVAFYTLLAARKFSIPKVLTIWGSDVLVNPKRNLILKKITQYNLRTADFLTADANFVVDEVLRLTRPKHPVLVANFGIGITPQPTEKKDIIYSNRLHKNMYRIDKIIDAFELFVNQHPTWKLVVAATGEESENLKKRIAVSTASDKIEWVGWVQPTENEKWYSTSKIWVSIPESDATAISLLEALACDCIPVVSDLPANREWIEDGINGVIVDDVDTEFLSRALQIDQRKASVINQKLIAENGTRAANKAKFIHLYDQALK